MVTRTERVRLELDDAFTSGMARAAASAALLRQQLDALGRVNMRSTTTINNNMQTMSRNADQAGGSINQLTGRLGLLADAALILGPGLVPVGAVGAQALGGLAAAGTAAALAGGAAAIAFQGVGDAVKAVDAYQLDPTVATLEKAQEALEALGPSAANFVMEFQKFQPVLTGMRDAAAEGFFPGLTASLDDFERAAPQIERLLEASGRAAGDMAADFAEALASDRWQPFLEFLSGEVPQAMGSLSRIMGDLTHGLGELFMATDPGNDRFLDWVEGVATGFDNWASSSEGRDDIAAFLDYARETGPDVAELFSSLVDGLAGIVKAAAPLGGPVLDGLTAVIDLVGTIANSDLGTPIIAGVLALRLYTRGAALAAAAQGRLSAAIATTTGRTAALGSAAAISAANLRALNAAGLSGTALGAALVAPRASDIRRQEQEQRARMLRTAGMAAGLGLAFSGVADDIGLMNTAMLSMAGPVGAAVGLLIDFTQHTNGVEDATANMNAVLASSTSTFADVAAAQEVLTNARKDYLDSYGSVGGLANSLANDPVSTMMESWKLGFDLLDGTPDRLNEVAGATKVFSGETEMLGRNLLLLGQQMGDTTPITAGDLIDPDVDRVQGILDSLTPALSAMGIELSDLEGMSVPELAQLASDLKGMNGELAASSGLLQGFAANMGAVLGLLTERSDWRAFQAAIDDATDALERNGRTLDANTPKGRENAAALDNIVASGLKVAEGMKGLERRDFLKGLRQQVRETAESFGATPKYIQTLMDALNKLGRQRPKPQIDLDDKPLSAAAQKARAVLRSLGLLKPNPAADLDISDLQGAVAAATAAINSLNGKTATTYVRTVFSSSGNLPGALQRGAQPSADGSTVPKTGMPYADRHLYMLADGEEIISNRNGQADKNRAALKAANQGAKLAVIGYAFGGTVGEQPSGGMNQAGATTGFSPFPSSAANAANSLSAAMLRLTRLTLKELNARERRVAQEIKLTEREIRRDEREVRRDERALEREKRETQVLKDRVEVLNQERDAIRESVAARFASDPFSGAVDAATRREDEIARLTEEVERKREGLDQTGSVEDRIKFGNELAELEMKLFSLQRERPDSIEDILRADIVNAQELEGMISKLGSAGLDGDALTYLLQSATEDQIRAYADGPAGDVQRYEDLFNVRNAAAGQAGSAAAQAEGVSGELAAARVVYEAQLVVQRSFAADLKMSNVELREHTKELRELNRRQDRLERAEEIKERRREERADRRAKQQSEDTGKAVGNEINDAASTGARRR